MTNTKDAYKVANISELLAQMRGNSSFESTLIANQIFSIVKEMKQVDLKDKLNETAAAAAGVAKEAAGKPVGAQGDAVEKADDKK